MSKIKRPRYFTPNEVSLHSTTKDIWVSFLGKVYNLTPLIEEHSGSSKLFLLPNNNHLLIAYLFIYITSFHLYPNILQISNIFCSFIHLKF